jgi:hypothetical protein
MSIIDKAKDAMGDMTDKMSEERKERMNMLTHREQQGDISDSDRTELQRLREQMSGTGM